MNLDLSNERKNSTINVEEMKSFLGRIQYGSEVRYQEMMNLSKINKKIFLSSKYF